MYFKVSQVTIQHGIHLKKKSSLLHLHACCDADWASDATNRHSTGAYIAYFGCNPVSCASQKQCSIAKSSTEAKYRTIASTTSEVL